MKSKKEIKELIETTTITIDRLTVEWKKERDLDVCKKLMQAIRSNEAFREGLKAALGEGIESNQSIH